MVAYSSPFRAIIVGGGPVGLTAAHSFTKAGIDFIVLESRDTCTPESGSSLVLNPGSLRVLGQLGLADKCREVGAVINSSQVVTWDGNKYKESKPFEAFDNTLGQRPLAFHRKQLLEVLYNNLPLAAKERIFLNKKVVDIETNADSAVVHCTDGTSYTGSIVIGADGVYSKTRGLMRKLALAEAEVGVKGAENVRVNEERPYVAAYRCMWGTVPRPAGLQPGDLLDCHSGRGASSMFINGLDRSWFFIYELLDKPTRERQDYTEKDMEDYASRIGDMHISENLTFSDVWATRESAGMSNLDEGILDVWSWNRIVLTGDAVHKVTPNAGWGLNSGIQDIAVLSNGLESLLRKQTTGHVPSVTDLASVFAAYREARFGQMKEAYSISQLVTRASARGNSVSSWLFWFFDELSSRIPHFDYYMISKRGAPLISRGYALDFVAGDEPFTGSVAWKHPIRAAIVH